MDNGYEYKSDITLFGLPLVHVYWNPRRPFKPAKGIIAIGMSAIGAISIGVFSIGLISIGLLAMGIFGIVAVGGLSLGWLTLIGAVLLGVSVRVSFGLLVFAGIVLLILFSDRHS